MLSARDAILFIAGAQTAHTLMYLALSFPTSFLLTLPLFLLKKDYAFWGVLINGLSAAILFAWGLKLP